VLSDGTPWLLHHCCRELQLPSSACKLGSCVVVREKGLVLQALGGWLCQPRRYNHLRALRLHGWLFQLATGLVTDEKDVVLPSIQPRVLTQHDLVGAL